MYDCPKFESCSAPACPLLAPLSEQKHLNGERTCYYLREAQKIDSEAVFEQSGLGDLYKLMTQATVEAFSNPDTSIYLKISLRKAALTSSLMAKGQNLIKEAKNKAFVGCDTENTK